MSEKPKKRLVGWSQYLEIIGSKWLNYGFGVMCLTFGVLLLIVCAVGIVWRLCICMGTGMYGITGLLWTLGFCVFWGGVSIMILKHGKTMFMRAKTMEPVAPITRHNAGDLPEAEILVRGSDRPVINPHAELLRATRQQPEMPPEQLLRATQENRQDV